MGSIGAVSSMRELRESVRASNLDHAVDAMKMVCLCFSAQHALCIILYHLVHCCVNLVTGG